MSETPEPGSAADEVANGGPSDHPQDGGSEAPGGTPQQTIPAGKGTDPASERTQLADERTQLADSRTQLADSRTQLAVERTRLAWWRTAFAVLAVGLAIAKIVPQLAGNEVLWPFTTLGAMYGFYAIGLIVYGSRRERVEVAAGTGESAGTPVLVPSLITGGAVFLAVATSALIIFS